MVFGPAGALAADARGRRAQSRGAGASARGVGGVGGVPAAEGAGASSDVTSTTQGVTGKPSHQPPEGGVGWGA
jgi:hypothetical protein